MSEFWLTRRDVRALTVLGVARPGLALPAVRSDLEAVASQMHNAHRESYPSVRGFGRGAESLLEEVSGPARETLALLLATSAFVLAIACANVANLTLVRLASRIVAAGTIGALWLARVMQGLVFGIAPRDPLTLAAACLTLAAVGLGASFGPARRATAVDPVIALRNG